MSIFNKLDFYFFAQDVYLTSPFASFNICYVIYSYRTYLTFTKLTVGTECTLQGPTMLTNRRYRRAPTISCAVARAIDSKTV